jgi:hypothetical protein
MRMAVAGAMSVFLVGFAAADPAPRDMSPDQAYALALRAIGQPHADLEPFPDTYDGFYLFEWINPNPNMSLHVLSLAVNRRSGDVWSIDDLCHHLWPRRSRRALAMLKSPRNLLPPLCDNP